MYMCVCSVGQAELKHGRLAMFAAVAWPLAEVVDQSLVDSEDATQQSRDLPLGFNLFGESASRVLRRRAARCFPSSAERTTRPEPSKGEKLSESSQRALNAV